MERTCSGIACGEETSLISFAGIVTVTAVVGGFVARRLGVFERQLDDGAVTPQPFEAIVLSRVLMHDVDDEIAVVQQPPTVLRRRLRASAGTDART